MSPLTFISNQCWISMPRTTLLKIEGPQFTKSLNVCMEQMSYLPLLPLWPPSRLSVSEKWLCWAIEMLFLSILDANITLTNTISRKAMKQLSGRDLGGVPRWPSGASYISPLTTFPLNVCVVRTSEFLVLSFSLLQ